MARFRKHYGRYRINRLVLFFLLLFSFCLILYAVFVIQLVPVMKTLATNRAKVISTTTINNAVSTVIKEDNISYDKLMSFEKDKSGNITALKANSTQINLFKYDVTNEVIQELNNIDSSYLKIPVGTLIGGPVFTNRGPNINIKISPVGTVDSEITNEFTSTGINQTRQQIMLNVKTSITIIMGSYNISTDVTSNLCIAETVIVGSVPQQYTIVEDSSGTAGKVYTYGNNK